MLKTRDFGPVRQYILARSFFGRTLYRTAAYLVDGLLIDTGCAHTADELGRALAGVKIDRIVHTHSHEDHIGADALLQQTRALPVYVHPDGVPVLADPDRLLDLRLYQVLIWGRPQPVSADGLCDRVETGRRSFRVIHTPGHSPDHVCLLEENEGWLFTGDAYVGGKDRVLRADYNAPQIAASLRRLSQTRPEVLYTAAGSVKQDAVRALTEKADYLESLGEKVREKAAQGYSRKEIRKRVLGPEPAVCYMTGGHFAGKHLVRSLLEDGPADDAEKVPAAS